MKIKEFMLEHGRSSPEATRHPRCKCGAKGEHDAGFDAYYCPKSGAWLEECCSDSECDFCVDRTSTRVFEVSRESDGRWIVDVPAIPGVMLYGFTRGNAIIACRKLARQVLGDTGMQIEPWLLEGLGLPTTNWPLISESGSRLLNELNQKVTAAIFTAEHEKPDTLQEALAYGTVTDLEEEIAALTDPSTVPGQASRVGAVRAALMSDTARAEELYVRYREDNLSEAVRAELDNLMAQHYEHRND